MIRRYLFILSGKGVWNSLFLQPFSSGVYPMELPRPYVGCARGCCLYLYDIGVTLLSNIYLYLVGKESKTRYLLILELHDLQTFISSEWKEVRLFVFVALLLWILSYGIAQVIYWLCKGLSFLSTSMWWELSFYIPLLGLLFHETWDYTCYFF